MTDQEKIAIIATCSLFQDLSPKDLVHIAKITQEKILPKKTVFIEEGTEGQEAYVISKGLARVFHITEEGKEVQLALRKMGEIVGELAILDEDVRSAHVQAIQDTHLLVFSKKELQKVIHKYPSVALGLIKTLAKRIRENIEELESLTAYRLNTRMLKLLITLASYFPNNEITMSHEELAQLLGATRPRVTEALKDLVKTKKISISHKKIAIVP